MLTISKKMIRSFIAVLFTLSFAVYAQSVEALFQHSGAPVAGNPDGKITLVEFFDYNCQHCMNMAPIVDGLIKTNPDLRVVFIDYPVLGQSSELAARAALAAERQGKYLEFNQALLLSGRELSENTVLQTAKILGLNVDRLDKDMASSAVAQQLQSNYSFAQQFNINGTPAFVVGRTDATNPKEVTVIYGEASRGELENAIQKNSR